MKETIQKMIDFRNSRGWQIHDTPKEIAMAIVIEAAELLENFQWKSSEEAIKINLENIQDELADVLMNCFILADDMKIDLEAAMLRKLKKNEEKYPITKFYQSNLKYNELEGLKEK